MSQRNTLGLCPECSTNVPRSKLLIEYETDDRHIVFAECPTCQDGIIPDSIGVPSLDPDRSSRDIPGTTTLEIALKLDEIRDVVGEDTEIVTAGEVVFIDRPITIDEKEALKQRLAPQRMKNLMDRHESQIEL